MARLDKEEREIKRSVESGEWRPVRRRSAEIERLRKAAKGTFKKDRRINIRISTRDLEALKKRALREGVPYQTLIASVLHKYAAGHFTERSA